MARQRTPGGLTASKALGSGHRRCGKCCRDLALGRSLFQVGKLQFKKELNYTVTFHDPCYLGRHNGEFDAPRQVLRAIPGLRLVEMAHNRYNSFCCGGGGGGMWMDGFVKEHTSERLSEKRVREAVEAGADVLAVACPYEVSRFEDAVKSTGNEGRLVVRDIAELLDEALQP